MWHKPTRERLQDLEERVARIERSLALDATPDLSPPESTSPAPTLGDTAKAPAGPPRVLASSTSSVLRPAPPTSASPRGAAGTTAPPSPVDSQPLGEPAGEQPPTARPQQRSWEMLIGMSWMAWAGAILVVLAAAFFVKLAYDQGWLARLTPLAKCLLSAAFGTMLLVAGEWALRRIGRVAAASLFGAGLGTLYLTAYATFRWFNLLSPTGAFWLLLVVALVGFAITARARLITTGVLATLGGYLTPVLLREASSFPGALPLYLTMLLAVALLLSAWKPHPFRPLRYVALCCHALVAAFWAFHQAPGEWQLALVFMGLWWLLVNAEGALAALRGQSALGNPIASLFVTAWVAVIGHWLLQEVQPGGRDWLGLFAVSLAALAAVPAAALGPGVRVLQHRPRRALEKLGVALWAQAGILLATAIGFQFDDFGQTIGWLALGLACVEVGRRLPSRGVDLFGLLVGALAIYRVVLVDSQLAVLHGAFWQFGDVRLTYWGLLALGAVFTTYLSALRLQVHGSPPRKRMPVVLMALGTFGWWAVCLTQTDDLATSWGWLVAAAVLIACERLGRRQRCFELGYALVWLSGIKWLLIDAGATRLGSTWNPTATIPILNELFAVALVIAASFLWAARVRFVRGTTGDAKPGEWQRSAICGAVFLLVALSFQLEHTLGRLETQGWRTIWPPMVVRSLWWTLLWAAGGLTLVLVGANRRWTGIHYSGWGILTLAALTWLSNDTLVPRLTDGITLARVVLNLQFTVGVLIAAAVAVAIRQAQASARSGFPGRSFAQSARAVGLGLIVAIGLWLGSVELDRLLAPEAGRLANAAMARQTAFSIYWGLYAIGLVVLGFARRMTWVRYVGLGLLTVTLGKVLVVDLAAVGYAYRVLSFLGVGLLLMLTSLAYARLSRQLFGDESRGAEPESDARPKPVRY
jgi:uncharacterized membrane protein